MGLEVLWRHLHLSGEPILDIWVYDRCMPTLSDKWHHPSELGTKFEDFILTGVRAEVWLVITQILVCLRSLQLQRVGLCHGCIVHDHDPRTSW